VCYGPCLLPEQIEAKVNFVESVMEVLPANYYLALAVGAFVVKHYTGADPTSMGTRFWASSVLINAIFRAVPVAP
jgi:membrane protein YdbS with pleckstrin-like domain